VAERPWCVQELAEALGVSPPTVSHHLFRLRSAGLVAAGRQGAQVNYRLETDRIEQLSRALLGVKTSPPRDERERVLRAYFDGERLIRLPRNRRKRLNVLEQIANRFEHGRRYLEREVNSVLRGVYADHATLRRDLIDYRFMTRDRGIYQRPINGGDRDRAGLDGRAAPSA